MTPEHKAEIRTMAACNWGVSFEDALDLLAALDAAEQRRDELLDSLNRNQLDLMDAVRRARAAEKENQALRARLGDLDPFAIDFATPTDGTP